MGLCCRVFLCLGFLVLVTAGYEEPRFSRFLQALKTTLKKRYMESERLLDRRGFDFECRNVSQTCSFMKLDKCCGDLDCYYPGGVKTREGVCVAHFKKDYNCNKDGQCQSGLQCDRHSLFRIEGTCQHFRTPDQPCYWDGQCSSKQCGRKWYNLRPGKCS